MIMDDNIKEHLKETWEAGKDTAKSMVNNEEVQQNWERTKDAARGVYDSAKDSAADTYYRAKQKASNWQEGACECIQDNPWKSVSVAFLGGLIVGLLLKSK
jgi:ElaB/YqjD/DUF883 family membrane-anchored ribosome-binding protein